MLLIFEIEFMDDFIKHLRFWIKQLTDIIKSLNCVKLDIELAMPLKQVVDYLSQYPNVQREFRLFGGFPPYETQVVTIDAAHFYFEFYSRMCDDHTMPQNQALAIGNISVKD